MGAILWIAYLAMGFVQIFAIVKGIKYFFDLHIIISSFIAIICSQIPFIGAVAGIIGAKYGWGWEWWQSIVLFMWQPIIFLFMTGAFRIVSFFQNNKSSYQSYSEKNNGTEKYENDTELKHNVFIRMFRGELSLPVSYWVFGVLGGVIWNFIFNFTIGLFEERHQVAVNFIRSYGMTGYKMLFSFMFTFCLFYFSTVYVGQWRCAERYGGKKVWPVLVKMTIFLGCIAQIAGVSAMIKLLSL